MHALVLANALRLSLLYGLPHCTQGMAHALRDSSLQKCSEIGSQPDGAKQLAAIFFQTFGAPPLILHPQNFR
jgi:hypothetical protein